MATAPVVHNDLIAKLVPGGAQRLTQLSDDELLANTRRLVGQSNQLLAALLEHLAEVEARGVHRARRCASLYTYCIYELRFSEDAAARRSAAARFAKEFPALLDAVAAGELHLTGLLMLGPHLTLENHSAVLARAKFRTKKELERLVRELNPLPQVPDRIEPLGPLPATPAPSLANPSWERLVTSLSPQIRELPAGERPCDWANDGIEDSASSLGRQTATPDGDGLPVGPVPSDLPPITGPQHFQMQFGTVEAHVQLVERAKALLARARPGVTLGELHHEAMTLLVAALEKRKFAVTAQPRKLRESPRQRDGAPDKSNEASTTPRQRVGVAHDSVEASAAPRQRVAVPDNSNEAAAVPHERVGAPPNSNKASAAPGQRVGAADNSNQASAAPGQRVAAADKSNEASATPRQRVAGPDKLNEASAVPRQRVAVPAKSNEASAAPRQRVAAPDKSNEASAAPRQRVGAAAVAEASGAARERRQRGRYVPAAVRREVYRRDGGRCAYVDVRGERCCETHYLELHHLQPFAKNGAHSVSNLSLRCAAHNALAAEQDFGLELITERRSSTRHEAMAAQTRVAKARFE